jgi:hypothetical protein
VWIRQSAGQAEQAAKLHFKFKNWLLTIHFKLLIQIKGNSINNGIFFFISRFIMGTAIVITHSDY